MEAPSLTLEPSGPRLHEYPECVGAGVAALACVSSTGQTSDSHGCRWTLTAQRHTCVPWSTGPLGNSIADLLIPDGSAILIRYQQSTLHALARNRGSAMFLYWTVRDGLFTMFMFAPNDGPGSHAARKRGDLQQRDLPPHRRFRRCSPYANNLIRAGRFGIGKSTAHPHIASW